MAISLFNNLQLYASILSASKNLLDIGKEDNPIGYQINTRLFNNSLAGMILEGYPFNKTTVNGVKFITIEIDGKSYKLPYNTLKNIIKQKMSEIENSSACTEEKSIPPMEKKEDLGEVIVETSLLHSQLKKELNQELDKEYESKKNRVHEKNEVSNTPVKTESPVHTEASIQTQTPAPVANEKPLNPVQDKFSMDDLTPDVHNNSPIVNLDDLIKETPREELTEEKTASSATETKEQMVAPTVETPEKKHATEVTSITSEDLARAFEEYAKERNEKSKAEALAKLADKKETPAPAPVVQQGLFGTSAQNANVPKIEPAPIPTPVLEPTPTPVTPEPTPVQEPASTPEPSLTPAPTPVVTEAPKEAPVLKGLFGAPASNNEAPKIETPKVEVPKAEEKQVEAPRVVTDSINTILNGETTPTTTPKAEVEKPVQTETITPDKQVIPSPTPESNTTAEESPTRRLQFGSLTQSEHTEPTAPAGRLNLDNIIKPDIAMPSNATNETPTQNTFGFKPRANVSATEAQPTEINTVAQTTNEPIKFGTKTTQEAPIIEPEPDTKSSKKEKKEKKSLLGGLFSKKPSPIDDIQIPDDDPVPIPPEPKPVFVPATDPALKAVEEAPDYLYDKGQLYQQVHIVNLKAKYTDKVIGPYRFIFWPLKINGKIGNKAWAEVLIHITDLEGNKIVKVTDAEYNEVNLKLDGKEFKLYAVWDNGMLRTFVVLSGQTDGMFTIDEEVEKKEPDNSETDDCLEQFRNAKKGQPMHFVVPFKDNNGGEANIPIVGMIEINGHKAILERRENNKLAYSYRGIEKEIQGHWEKGKFVFTVEAKKTIFEI